MNHRVLIRLCSFPVDLFVAACLVAVFYGAAWEFSTRSYLRGFSDAIIPASDNPEQKIEAILAWMQNGAARRSDPDSSALAKRDPVDTLNYRQLLSVCGTATNAFVNLAESTGLRARRLLLLDGRRLTKHVVAEIFLGGRWIVVDPTYHSLLRTPDGRLVTRLELVDPEVFLAVTASIPNYPASFTYDNTVHVRLSRIPIVGLHLRRFLDKVYPSWEESARWTLLLERESLGFLAVFILLLIIGIFARATLNWYFFARLGVRREQFWTSEREIRGNRPVSAAR